MKIYLDDVNIRAIYLGSWMRLQDAGVFLVGLDFNKYRLGVSYDINVSNLNVASDGRGGLEVAIIYIIQPKPPKRLNYKICPDFIDMLFG